MALASDITYTSAIAADDFTQTEVDNLRTAKLDDATTPWTNASNITSGTLTNISAATPTADTHVATKAYVDASTPPLYIVTTTYSCGTCRGRSGADGYCPSGWSLVVKWPLYRYSTGNTSSHEYSCVSYSMTFNASGGGSSYVNEMRAAVQALCLKD